MAASHQTANVIARQALDTEDRHGRRREVMTFVAKTAALFGCRSRNVFRLHYRLVPGSIIGLGRQQSRHGLKAIASLLLSALRRSL